MDKSKKEPGRKATHKNSKSEAVREQIKQHYVMDIWWFNNLILITRMNAQCSRIMLAMFYLRFSLLLIINIFLETEL
jgi:hypothetical protein